MSIAHIEEIIEKAEAVRWLSLSLDHQNDSLHKVEFTPNVNCVRFGIPLNKKSTYE